MTYSAGIPDEEFIRGDIPMTKAEIRILVMAKARIQPGEMVIDIGAGTGSLSIEAALQSQTGAVYAIEREREGIELITANAAKFGAVQVRPVHGSAPDVLAEMTGPADVILIGGSGGQLTEILHRAGELLKDGGRMVITAITVETLSTALTVMQANPAFSVEACGVQISRIRRVGGSNMLQGLNPIYLITCTKGEQ